MRGLILYEDYSRKEVHDIFAPEKPFTPQAGTWGMQGYVDIPNRPGDFVFFVTFGKKQGSHVFDEGITEDGVLSWQSQPRQGFGNTKIKQWINHDELTNTIYLFLRTSGNKDYTYLGRLQYLSHDIEREYPVYFQWQIIDWNIPIEVAKKMDIHFQPNNTKTVKTISVVDMGRLQETQIPPVKIRTGTSTQTFRAHKVYDHSRDDAKNKRLGMSGELLVIDYEKKSLAEANRLDLSEKVRHISKIEGDGAGYDIQSFYPNGTIKYIEVKTTCGPAETPFYITSNELKFSKQHSDKYCIYRVYEYDKNKNSGKFFVVNGNIELSFTLTPIQYRVH